MNMEKDYQNKEKIPFPPETYVEARAYYAESDYINTIRTAQANGFLKGYINELESSGLDKEEIGEWKARIAISKKMLTEGNMPPYRVNFYTGVSESFLKEYMSILKSGIK